MNKTYCVTNGDFTEEGTVEEIVNSIFEWDITEKRALLVKARGYSEATFHSYNSEFSDEEIYQDVIRFLFKKLPSFGYRIYK